MTILKNPKKLIIRLLIVPLGIVIGFALFRPVIETRMWVLSYAQQTSPAPFVVAHNKDLGETVDLPLYEISKPIELICEAKDGKLVLTDKTNGKVYEGTYKISSYGVGASNQSYRVVIEGTEGYASISKREIHRMLLISIGDHILTFEKK